MVEVMIDAEFITLGQFLKLVDVIDSGGAAKFFLQEEKVIVNDQEENRRGRKLYENDRIEIIGFGKYVIKLNH